MRFVHLHTHSHYSLLDGLAKIDDLIARAKELGMDSLALTDHGNLYGAIEFYKKARKAGIKPILGVEAYLAPNGLQNKRPRIDEARFHITLLAQNNTGWQNLIQLVTISNLEGFYYKPRIDRETLAAHSEGVICLSGCPSGEVSKSVAAGNNAAAEELVRTYRHVFGDRFFLEVQSHAPELHDAFRTLSKQFSVPLVATQDIHYAREDDQTAHEILLAVQTNTKLDDTDRMTLKKYNLSMLSTEAMERAFAHLPEALETTNTIADSCSVEIPLGKTHLPKFNLPDSEPSSDAYLAKLIEERLPSRYPDVTPDMRKRIEMELEVIKKTGFADYFLIVQDFVNWAKTHGIVVGPGRGSAAGSIVSFILNITNIDPLQYGLLFERFLNPDRIQVPDIDIDFTDTRRDEVVAYVRERYGSNRVAQIITFGTMAARAAIRDTGRALGLPYGVCDQIAKLIPFQATLADALEQVPDLKTNYDTNPETKHLLDAARKLEGVARHASVHACGVVIAPEPLTNFMPLQRAPQGDDAIITQFEMHSVEDLGILKMDFLGLKNLTIIEKALRLIQETRGETVDINTLPLDDERTFALFQSGETTGIFQLESSGMRHYLKELRPSELEDVIAMIALYRPGPMELIPHYIKRKFKQEPITYLHPKLEPILANTYGVGVYQEQMMRIARDLAGFSLAEADTLRKAIGKKIKELLDEQKDRLIKGMIGNGIEPRVAQDIWELFPPFARYGFNRSHAAAYAMVSYQTAYLKAHYPTEFTASLLNIASGDIDRINFLVNEARRLAIRVLPPDINLSFQNFTVDDGAIRFGLLAIKNLGANIVDAIITERSRGGSFESCSDLLMRIHHRDLNKKSLEALVKAGALDSLGIERSQILENIEELVKFNQAARKDGASNQHNLFDGVATLTSLRLRPAEPIDKNILLGWEKELLGLYITDHPFSQYVERLKGKAKTIQEVLALPKPREGGQFGPRCRFAGIVTNVHKIFTKKGQPMLFVTLEDLSRSLEMLVFSELVEKHQSAWQPNKAVFVEGRMSWRNDEPKFVCDAAKEL